MKVILKDGVYQKVENEVAESEVRFGRAKFAPKSEWKKNVRDNQSVEAKIAEIKGEATKNKKADKAAKLRSKQRPGEFTDKFVK